MSRIVKLNFPTGPRGAATFRNETRTSKAFSPQEELQRLWGPLSETSLKKLGPEWQSLSKETHRELFFQDMRSLGARFQKQGDCLLADRVLRLVEERAPQASLRDAAAHELAVLDGGGSPVDLLELHSQTLLTQMTDPGIILPMMAASSAYALGRTATLARLAGGGGESWFSHGLGARLTAASVGFAGEVGAFSLAGRGMQWVADPDVVWSAEDWARHVRSNVLTLGLLKSFSFVGQQGALRLRHLNELGNWRTLSGMDRWVLGASSHLSSYLGLVSAHALEKEWGLSPETPQGNLWFEALAAHFALRWGGRLGREMGGPALVRLEQSLGERAEIFSRYLERPRAADFGFPLHLAMASAGSNGGGPSGPGGNPPAAPPSGGRGRRVTPVGLRIIQGVAAAIPDGWSNIKPVNLYLHLNTGEISASRPQVGPSHKITLMYRGKTTEEGIWRSRWMLTEESFKELVKVLARNPKSPVGDVAAEAVKALGTPEQGFRMLKQTRDAKRKTGRLGSEQFQVPPRPKAPETPPDPERLVTQARDNTFRATGTYHMHYGYVRVRPLLDPQSAPDLKKVFRVQVNSPAMIAPFTPDPEGAAVVCLIPWGNVQQMEQGRTPKHPEMLQLHVKHEVPLKIGDWVEVIETSNWQPRPFSAQVISPHYEGWVDLYAVRDLASSSDPAQTFRVQENREILDDGNRWDSDRLILVPHQAWQKTLVPGEHFHPLEVLTIKEHFPVKVGDWVRVDGEWGPRPIPGIGFAPGMRMRLNLHALSGFDALAHGGEDIFRIKGYTDGNSGAPGNLILIHHSMWENPKAKQLFVSLEKALPLHAGDWVRLEQLEDLSPGGGSR